MNSLSKQNEPDRKVKIIISIIFAFLLIGAGVFLASGGPTGIAARPGILGTRANLFSDLNLFAQILLLLGLCAGAVLARRGHISAHQYNQTWWVLFNIILTIFIMVVAYFEYVIPGLPDDLRNAHGIVSTIHAALGLLAILCGVYLILRMNQLIPKRWRVKWWRKLMRITLGLYVLVGLFGLVIYYVWFVS